MSPSTYQETVSRIEKLSNAELDRELEETAVVNERTEMQLCCYLAAVRERRAYEEFGYQNVCDYAFARFGFGPRKTRYLVSLGRKLDRLPKLRQALLRGELGWCKASRVASVAAPENEAMWLESALSLTVAQLERKIKDGTDSLATMLHLPLTEERRILWENALEIFRRRAGSELSPVEAFELMTAEVLAEWGHHLADVEPEAESTDEAAPAAEPAEPGSGEPPVDEDVREDVDPLQLGLWEDERAAERAFATTARFDDVRGRVLERDGWKCTYPGCDARKDLHVHHIVFRSRGGCDAPWNLTVLCAFHHGLVHSRQIAVSGQAPLKLSWTPPRLMRAVLERRRNRPSPWLSDLEVRHWALESQPTG